MCPGAVEQIKSETNLEGLSVSSGLFQIGSFLPAQSCVTRSLARQGGVMIKVIT